MLPQKSLILIVLSGVLFACAAPPATAPANPAITQGLPSTAVPPTAQVAQPTTAAKEVTAPNTSAETECMAPASLTPSMTEGPYYKAGAPQRASLVEANTKGIKLVVTGYVLTADCKPVAKAWLDFWQADASGNYDNAGYTLRGYQYTDEKGRYQLTTIIPGLYPGRTEHIHFKVQAPNGPVLTSQLFFPDVPQNKSDGIFDPKLLLNMKDATAGKTATFNFVVNTK